MKNVLLLIVTASLFTFCSTEEADIAHHWDAYEYAMYNADINTAITEVNSILAYDTTNQSAIDTLARLYFIFGNSFGAYQMSKKVENLNEELKLILAESAMQLGKQEDAKKNYSELVASDTSGENIQNKYKLATLHFNDQEFKEAIELLSQVTTHEDAIKQATRISMENNTFQDVSLYAASWNFAGYIQSLVNDFDTAEKYYDEALRFQPNFLLAQNNKKRLVEQRKAATEE